MFLIGVISIDILFGAFELMNESDLLQGNELFIRGLITENIQPVETSELTPGRFWSMGHWNNYYNIKGLDRYSFLCGYTGLNRQIDGYVSSFGFGQLYRESFLRIYYHHFHRKKILLSAGTTGYLLSIKNYGVASGLGLNLGWLVKCTPQLDWWCNLYNYSRMGELTDDIPQVIQTGIRVTANDYFSGSVWWVHNLDYSGWLAFKTELRIIKACLLEVGYRMDPARIFIGSRIDIRNLIVGYNTVSHQSLGWSHEVSIGINISNR